MHLKNRFIPFVLILATLFFLTACGTSLEKPSGLENNQAESNTEQRVIDGEETDPNTNSSHDIDEADNHSEVTEVEPEKKSSEKKTETHNKPSESVKVESHNVKQDKPKSESVEKSDIDSGTRDKEVSSNPVKKDPPKKKDDIAKKPEKTEKPEPEKPQPKPEQPKPDKPKQTIIHSIVVSTETNHIPLSPTEQEITNGDTVLSALIAITKQHNIQLHFSGGQGAMGYVDEIANVREFAEGLRSGWLYRINGKYPDRGAGAVTLCSGDRVEWIYTTTLGEDEGASNAPFHRDGACTK